MKVESWKLWLFAAFAFSFVGIMNLVERKYAAASGDLLLGVCYIIISISNYKKSKKSSKIKMPDSEPESLDIELNELIKQGKKIEAIKRYRMVTGMGLKEAKDYVDSLSEKVLISKE